MPLRNPACTPLALALVLACGPDKSTSTGETSATAGSSGSTSSATTQPTSGSTAQPTSSGSSSGEGSSVGGSSTGVASATASTTGDTGDCGGPCGNPEHLCCAGECIDPRNDRNNCGKCGLVCAEPTPFCGAGLCGVAPCGTTCGAGETCCDTVCCADGMICCQIDGPIQIGASCVAPTETNSCPPGCSPLCQCAAPDTPIATPDGERAIAELRVGDLVYSVDAGQIVAVPIAAIRRTPVTDHRVVRVVLADGHTMEISPSHPLGDGRSFADLRAGERLGGHSLTAAALVPYRHTATHDILPASDTGTYFVHGVLVGSTLGPTAPAQAPRACGVR